MCGVVIKIYEGKLDCCVHLTRLNYSTDSPHKKAKPLHEKNLEGLIVCVYNIFAGKENDLYVIFRISMGAAKFNGKQCNTGAKQQVIRNYIEVLLISLDKRNLSSLSRIPSGSVK